MVGMVGGSQFSFDSRSNILTLFMISKKQPPKKKTVAKVRGGGLMAPKWKVSTKFSPRSPLLLQKRVLCLPKKLNSNIQQKVYAPTHPSRSSPRRLQNYLPNRRLLLLKRFPCLPKRVPLLNSNNQQDAYAPLQKPRRQSLLLLWL